MILWGSHSSLILVNLNPTEMRFYIRTDWDDQYGYPSTRKEVEESEWDEFASRHGDSLDSSGYSESLEIES